MHERITLERHGLEAVPRVAGLWNLLFDHHLSIGAAGLPVIPRDRSWPLREAHYRRLFADRPAASIRLAIAEGAGAPLAYAMAYEDLLDSRRAVVLETLSVDPAARGLGIGTRLMEAVDLEAIDTGVSLGVVDVMGGNPRARALYLRHGYRPHSESWMRSEAGDAPVDGRTASLVGPDAERADPRPLAELARECGLDLGLSPGPDDTWLTANSIVELSAATLEEPRLDRLGALLEMLSAAEFWTVRIEIAAAPEARAARAALRNLGFKLSTERLVRELSR